MNRDESWQVIDDQRVVIADLLETLTPQEWATPSLCGAWTVGEVGAHLSLTATASLGDMAKSAIRARGNFDAMIREMTIARAAARSNAEIIADLRNVVGSRRLAPGTFWRDPLLDVLVHGQDLSRPIGRPLRMPIDASRTAADWAWQRGFPFSPARRFRGIRMVAKDIDWSRGSGEELRGPIASLLLLSTGRRSALADVRGPGLQAPGLRGATART
jgi:uncharacterized protein (TIGR03083 family)